MKTWEKLYKTWLKEQIEICKNKSRELKSNLKDLKEARTTIISNRKINFLMYHGAYIQQLTEIQLKQHNNKKRTTYYLSELNRLNNKENSHNASKKNYSFDWSITKKPEFEPEEDLFACYIELDYFKINKISKICDGKYIIGNRYMKEEDILKIGTEEECKSFQDELLISLKEDRNDLDSIQKELTKKQSALNEKQRKLRLEIDKERKALEEKIKKMWEDFDSKNKDSKQEISKLEGEMYSKSLELSKKKEQLIKEIKKGK